jgi:voltage-gated potassium channel
VEHFKQTLTFVLFSFVLVGFGCFGYMAIEGWSFFDSLYMTIITLATVGYSEIHEISTEGRFFTVVLIVLGVGFFLYVMSNIIQFLVEGQIRLVLGRRKLENQVNRLDKHYIVCGYGRIGRVLTNFLVQKYLDVVVIEYNKERADKLNEDGILYLLGDAKDENLLKKAGISRAKGLITSVATDADNVFLVLIAKQLNPDIFIVARAEQNTTKKTLAAAGADKVISPYDLGARRMAHAILRPTVIKFLEMAFADEETDIQLEEVLISENSEYVDVALRDSGIRQNLDLIINAIRKTNGEMVFNPGADTTLEAGDTLVVVGRARSLTRLQKMLSN